MARSKQEEPPKDWQPTQAVDDPIVNNAYIEPTAYWQYRDGVPELMEGRRPALLLQKSACGLCAAGPIPGRE